MACGSGCCGPPNDTPSSVPSTSGSSSGPAGPSVANPEVTCDDPEPDIAISSQQICSESCQDSCCGSIEADNASQVGKVEKQESCGAGCCPPPQASEADDCQDTSGVGVKNDRTEDQYCAPVGSKNLTRCKDACCDAAAQPQKQDDDCCAPPPRPEEKEGCCAPVRSKSAAKCKDACCDSPALPQKQDGNCCAPPPRSERREEFQAACCPPTAALVQPKQDPLDPECCKGKTSPCCDTNCIERIAERECQSNETHSCCDDVQGQDTGSPREKDSRACRSQLYRAYARYKAQLEAIGCICRAMIALGEESCCVKPRATPKQRACNRSLKSSASSLTSSSKSVFVARSALKKSSCGSLAKRQGCSKGCCDTVQRIPTQSAGCVEDCCNEKKPTCSISEQKISSVSQVFPDPEKSVSGSEHIALAISGMTCTGCETKLQRTLAMLEPVCNLKTSLVLSRAEFDLHLSKMTPEDVIKHLERTTEFKCEKISSLGSSLDLICPGDAVEFVNSKWPMGVTGVQLVDKTTIHVEFDANTVGARDLVEKGWHVPMTLAALKPDRSLDAGARHVRNVGLWTLLSIAMTIPVLVMAWAPLPEREIAYGSASLALATIIQFVIAGPFYPKALKALVFSRVIEMDLLIVLSTSAAYIFSVVAFGHMVAGQPLSTGEFFETSTLLISLIMVGRWVAALARQKAIESISIRSLQPTMATLEGQDGTTQDIDTRLLQFGDALRVIPDSSVPTDGTVVSGISELDESMMTGESRPVPKQVGSIVIAGSINGSGMLTVRLTRLPDDNTISSIASMVDEAKLSKPKIQETADQVATYFVPVVIVLTIITFSIWVAIGVAVQGKPGSDAIVQAITYGITVLIVSCPCAIGLAVPMVIVMASGIAAERGVVFKSSEAIEVAHKTKHVVFDKTGTLTEGKLEVTHEEYFGDDVRSSKSILLALVEATKHPVSVAIASHLKADGVCPSPDVANPEAIVGGGIEAQLFGKTIRAGNSRWLQLSSDPHVQSVLEEGCTTFCFVMGREPVAILGLKDTIRCDTASVVSKLHEQGINVHIVSGDDDAAVQAVAAHIGIAATSVRSRCSPLDKQTYIKDIRAVLDEKSSQDPVIIFCGDGTNDAPALAAATIGVHVNDGTDVAKAAADVVLTRPDLSGLLLAIRISKKSIHRIAFNFGWSFVYNLFAILLAAGAFVNARVPPAYAGLGELVSVLPVIFAGFLLRYEKI